MPAYDYNLGNNNSQSYHQANANVGRGGGYSQFNFQGNNAGASQFNQYAGQGLGQQTSGGGYSAQLAALQNANRGGSGGRLQGFGGAPLPQSPGNYNNPQSPYRGFSNFAYPGETGTQASKRMQLEYEAMGQKPLPAAWDAQRRFNLDGSPVGVGADGGIGTPGVYQASGAGGFGSSGGGTEAELVRQREIALQRIDDQRRLFDSGGAREIEQSGMNQMRGVNSPYAAQASRQLAENADAGAAAFARERDMARQFAANSGQSGGGMEYGAIMNAAREVGRRTTVGRREVQSTNQLLEDQRRERGRGQMLSYLQAKAQNAWDANRLEAEMRGRFQITGEGNQAGGAGGGAAGSGFQLNSGSATGGTIGGGSLLSYLGSDQRNARNGSNLTALDKEAAELAALRKRYPGVSV